MIGALRTIDQAAATVLGSGVGVGYYVSKSGSDSNNGKTPRRAKLTIASVLTAIEANGDAAAEVQMGPGTWAETVDLSTAGLKDVAMTFRGVGPGITAITSTSTGITFGWGRRIRLADLSIANTRTNPTSNQAIAAGRGATMGSVLCEVVILDRCFFESTGTGVNLDQNTKVLFMNECQVLGAEFGLWIGFGVDAIGGQVRNSTIQATGWTVCNATALLVSGNYNSVQNNQTSPSLIFENCSIKCRSSSNSPEGGEFWSNAVDILGGRVIFQSCDFIAEAAGTYTNPSCLTVEGSDEVVSKNIAYVLAHNCGFSSLVTRNTEQGAAYDVTFIASNGRCCLNACDFDPAKVFKYSGGTLLTSSDFVEVV
jgi:hypothetical protein